MSGRCLDGAPVCVYVCAQCECVCVYLCLCVGMCLVQDKPDISNMGSHTSVLYLDTCARVEEGGEGGDT